MLKVNEILSMEVNTEMESEYRRGYSDGFHAALQAVNEHTFMRRGLLGRMLSLFWGRELDAWKQGSGSEPPIFEILCSYCRNQIATALDHILPKSRGGSDDDENLAPACKGCNSKKGALTPDEWRTRDGCCHR